MREVTIRGRTYKVNGLSRRALRDLRRKGFNLFGLKVEQVDAAMDEVFLHCLSEKELEAADVLTHAEALPLWNAVLAETYGSREEEKNSSRSGPGTPTRSGPDTAASA